MDINDYIDESGKIDYEAYYSDLADYQERQREEARDDELLKGNDGQN